MAKRIKYEIDGHKVPSLSTIIENCKIGGIGNLLYRANQAGLAGRSYPNPTEDATNAGWCALKQIDSILNCNVFDMDEYSDSCVDKTGNAIEWFMTWKFQMALSRVNKDLTLVSDMARFGDTFNVYNYVDHDEVKTCLVMIVMQNEVYPENLIKLAADIHLLKVNNLNFGEKAFIIRINNPKTLDDPVVFNLHEYDEFEYPFAILNQMRKLYDMQLTLKTLL